MEALVMDFTSPAGSVFMQLYAMRYNRRRRRADSD